MGQVDPDALYALAPEDFTAARDAAAKAARADGDAAAAKALAALRRPSVAAWLVNRLAAGQAELLGQLLALGPALADAQRAGRADDLRALGQQRRALVEAVTVAAVDASGRAVTAAVRDEVAATLEAALADPASADAVRSGRLVRALSYAGFGGVDLVGAVAAVAGRPVPPSDDGTGKGASAAAERLAKERATAERAAHDAAGRLDDAVRGAERADRARADAQAALADADRAVAHARAALESAERDRAQRQAKQVERQEQHERAVAAVATAQQEADAARTALDRLRRS